MDPVYEGGPWTRSKEGGHGPGVHVLSSPTVARCIDLITDDILVFVRPSQRLL